MDKVKDKSAYDRITRQRIFFNRLFPYILIAPVVIYVAVFLLVPFLYGVGISFTDKKIGSAANFAGFQNYIDLLNDPIFVKSISNTLVYTFISVFFKVVLGVLMALVLNANIKCKNLARGLLLVPWAVPTAVSIFTWKWMYSDVGGVLNAILLGVGVIPAKVAWLSSPFMAMLSIIIVNVWRGAPFIGISVLSGLQTIPNDLYESATVDGAGPFSRFFYITLPSIKNVLMLATLVTAIWTFNDFEIIWLLTRGGPIDSTQVVSTYSYFTGIMKMDFSKAVAASALFMPIMLVLVNIITGYTLGRDEKEKRKRRLKHKT
jgi:multiple sugar transport system permease protein